MANPKRKGPALTGFVGAPPPAPAAAVPVAAPGGLPIPYSELKQWQVLGEGSQGTVRLVTHRTEAERYALKSIDLRVDAKAASREDFMLGFHNENVVRVYVRYNTPDTAYFLQEYMNYGSMEHVLHELSRPRGDRPPMKGLAAHTPVLLCVLRQILLGVKGLHDHTPPIIHRDLRPSNILANDAGFIKVSDFGLARALSPESMHLSYMENRGHEAYLAPESIRAEVLYTEKVDVWALGLTACELAYGHRPLFLPKAAAALSPAAMAAMAMGGGGDPSDQMNTFAIHMRLADGSYETAVELPGDTPVADDRFAALIRACLEWDAARRPSTTELLALPIFLDLATTVGTPSQQRRRIADFLAASGVPKVSKVAHRSSAAAAPPPPSGAGAGGGGSGGCEMTAALRGGGSSGGVPEMGMESTLSSTSGSKR